MLKFPKIPNLKNWLEKVGHVKATLSGTVKLRGCNTAIGIRPDGTYWCQSRNRVITPEDDHFGFASWVSEQVRTVFPRWRDYGWVVPSPTDRTVVYFGEWIGPGVQKGVGVSKLPCKMWVRFAEATEGPDGKAQLCDGYFQGPWPVWPGRYPLPIGDICPPYIAEIDTRDVSTIEEIWRLTEQVGKSCPFTERSLGLDGEQGEGIVWSVRNVRYEGAPKEIPPLFKTKVEMPGSSSPKVPKVKTQLSDGAMKLVEREVALRLSRALGYMVEFNFPFEVQNTSIFVRWVLNDIEEECVAELREEGITFEGVKRVAGKIATQMYKEAIGYGSSRVSTDRLLSTEESSDED
jgi:hypothetical protein